MYLQDEFLFYKMQLPNGAYVPGMLRVSIISKDSGNFEISGPIRGTHDRALNFSFLILSAFTLWGFAFLLKNGMKIMNELFNLNIFILKSLEQI